MIGTSDPGAVAFGRYLGENSSSERHVNLAPMVVLGKIYQS